MARERRVRYYFGMSLSIPDLIRTERLVLRPWRVEDAPVMKSLIDENLAHLQAWMPWAMTEPSPLEEITARITHFAAEFAAGNEWVFAIFRRDDDLALGGTGLHRRIGDDGLEIGYWIRADQTRRGFAREAAAALTRTAFLQPSVQRVQIRCDPKNVASAAVPRRLGYTHVETLPADTTTPAGDPRDTMVWELRRSQLDHAS